MSYASYAASVDATPFSAYSSQPFGSGDLRIETCYQPTVATSQFAQKQALKQHLLSQRKTSSQQLQHHHQHQRLRISWPLVWGALVVAAIVAVLLAFTPVGYPISAAWSVASRSTTTVHHHQPTATHIMVSLSG